MWNRPGTAVVQTDTSNIAETKGSRELIDLPVAITSRANGSTSPMSTLTAQPGVQTDPNGNISVAGSQPTQIALSIDGISSMGPATNGAITELFPSFNAIEEIRIGETINPAEFGGIADISTVSKAGTNQFHGGVFENLQNSYMNAGDTFSHITPSLKMNNFGIYLGGPVMIPKLYNGRNKTFFFGSFEALRLPKNVTAIESVPTPAMRNGNLSEYLTPGSGANDPNALTGYPGNIIPSSQISAYSQKALNTFFPLPNYGGPGLVSNNYLASFQGADQEQSRGRAIRPDAGSKAPGVCAVYLQEPAGDPSTAIWFRFGFSPEFPTAGKCSGTGGGRRLNGSG